MGPGIPHKRVNCIARRLAIEYEPVDGSQITPFYGAVCAVLPGGALLAGAKVMHDGNDGPLPANSPIHSKERRVIQFILEHYVDVCGLKQSTEAARKCIGQMEAVIAPGQRYDFNVAARLSEMLD